MRNLKKALCLALACVMLLGMMVMTTGAADFTDKDEIVNTEAVNTLVALNIINGKEDGSYFDPTGIVTRAEMCKMICVALNGGKDPQLGTVSTSFTDTNGSWAAGYIEYCYNLGIVAGRGDGTFDPTGTVTGTEAAKMLLVALGYNAKTEGFIGDSWAIAVNVRANQKDIYDELETLNPSNGLSRDDAAQMVYNAINAVMVEYNYQLTTVNGTLTTVAVVKDLTSDDTILAKKFDMDTAYGTMDSFTYDDTKSEWTYSISVASGTLGDTTPTTANNYTDLWGRSVKILSKTTSSKTTVYGIFADDSKVLATTTLGGLTITSGVTDSFKVGSTVYKMDSGALSSTNVYAFGEGSILCNLGNFTTVEKPYSISLIDDNNDGKVDFAIAVPFTVEKVTYVGSTTFTTNTGSVTTKDVNVYSGLAKNDYVMVVNGDYTADGKTTYTKIELLAGEVTATKDSGTTFKLGGTYYKLADSSAALSMPTTAVAGTEYEKIAVVNGYAFNMVETNSSTVTDYAVVVAATDSIGLTGPQVKLLFTDGTKKIVDADTDYTDYVDQMVTYSVNSDDEYELTLANEDVAAADTGFDIVVAAPDGSDADASGISASYVYAKNSESTIGDNYIASDAVVFIKDSSWKVVSGATLAKTSSAAISAVYNAYADSSSSTGFNTIKLACVAGTTVSGDTSYGYVTASPEIVKNSDGELVYSVTFFDGSTTVTANTADTASDLDAALATDVAKNTIITFTYDGSDLEITGCVSLSAANVGAVTALSSDKIKFAYNDITEDIDNDGTSEAVISKAAVTSLCSITDDTIVMFIDRANTKGVDGADTQLATKTADGNYIANCYYVLNGTDVTLLIVDVQNDILDVE
ncbi:hypothetical protein SDC9_49544 [bioreactor metagenome]|uniref:SLH domain-containing protein n=1 Tax=bioreactor metagenome TaxID=1076179 RepID=A0A644WI60_9ZZZZ